MKISSAVHFEPARDRESDSDDPFTTEPSIPPSFDKVGYYLSGGCAIFACALARLNPGSTIGLICLEDGKIMNYAIPIHPYHAYCDIPGIGPFEIRGSFPANEIAELMGLRSGEYSVCGPWDPESFRKIFMGRGRKKIFHGTEAPIDATAKAMNGCLRFPLNSTPRGDMWCMPGVDDCGQKA